ncbi:MAG: hypothetical protein U0Y68_27175 [Blastocatellia bacterium]
MHYRAFANTIKAEAVRQRIDFTNVSAVCVMAFFSLPASWSKKRKNSTGESAASPDAGFR